MQRSPRGPPRRPTGSEETSEARDAALLAASLEHTPVSPRSRDRQPAPPSPEASEEEEQQQQQQQRAAPLKLEKRKNSREEKPRRSRSQSPRGKKVTRHQRSRSRSPASGSPLSGEGVLLESISGFEGDADDNELSFQAGQVIRVVQEQPDGWWLGSLVPQGDEGFFPVTFTKPAAGGAPRAAATSEIGTSSSRKSPRSPRRLKLFGKKKHKKKAMPDMQIERDPSRVGGFGLNISTVRKKKTTRSRSGRDIFESSASVEPSSTNNDEQSLFIVQRKEKSSFPGFRVSTMQRPKTKSPRQAAENAFNPAAEEAVPLSDGMRAKISSALWSGKLSMPGRNLGIIPTSVMKIPTLTNLNLSSNMLKSLPEGFARLLPDLLELDLSFNPFEAPSSLDLSPSVINLSLRFNQMETLPALENMHELSGLDLRFNRLAGQLPCLPEAVSRLTEIILTGNELTGFEAGSLRAASATLALVDVANNKLTSLEGLDGLAVLERLYVAHNELAALPPQLGEHLRTLVVLDLSHNNLSGVPKEMAQLKALRVLRLRNNRLRNMACPVDSFPDLRLLDVSHNRMMMPPSGLEHCSQLRTLNVSNNPFRPDKMSQLSWAGLQNMSVFLAGNAGFKELHPSLLLLSSLEVLYLGYNGLELRPSDSFAALKRLKILNLSGNGLRALPDSFLDREVHSRLTQVDLTDNALEGDFAAWEGVQVTQHHGPTVGACETAGLRPYMEDRTVVTTGLYGTLLAVFDGHGGEGAAQLAQDHVETLLLRHGTDKLPTVFNELDKMARAAPELQRCGATGLVCVLKDNVLHVANAGDTRAVLSRGGKAVRLTVDHKPEAELERIRSGRGTIVDGRLGGVIAVSRAIGDPTLPLVTSEPQTAEIQVREGEDEFLILACDGVWDEMSDQMAVNVCKGRGAAEAAAFLKDEAFFLGSQDNISVVVYPLRTA